MDLYEGLWGEHVHHGFWDPGERPEPGRRRPPRGLRSHRRELAAFAGFPAGASVLDAGCGIGGPALHLVRELGCRVEGITLSSQQAARAGQRARTAGLADRTGFRQLDAVRTDYPDGSFDVVWALESLEHMPDRAAFFTEALPGPAPGRHVGREHLVRARRRPRPREDLELSRLIYQRQAIPSLQSRPEYERLCRVAGFVDVRTADWTDNVRPHVGHRFHRSRPAQPRPVLRPESGPGQGRRRAPLLLRHPADEARPMTPASWATAPSAEPSPCPEPASGEPFPVPLAAR